jgi:hypothetical protein
MTSRVAIELLFRRQPAQILGAKSSVEGFRHCSPRALSKETKLLPIVESFDVEQAERILVSWDERVLRQICASGINESQRNELETLNLFEPQLAGTRAKLRAGASGGYLE